MEMNEVGSDVRQAAYTMVYNGAALDDVVSAFTKLLCAPDSYTAELYDYLESEFPHF